MKANEAITLKLIFKGSGNLKYMKNPDLKLPNDFDTYDPKVDVSVKATTGGVSGTRTVEYTTIPRFAIQNPNNIKLYIQKSTRLQSKKVLLVKVEKPFLIFPTKKI